jgi:hypothetical protein
MAALRMIGGWGWHWGDLLSFARFEFRFASAMEKGGPPETNPQRIISVYFIGFPCIRGTEDWGIGVLIPRNQSPER